MGKSESSFGFESTCRVRHFWVRWILPAKIPLLTSLHSKMLQIWVDSSLLGPDLDPDPCHLDGFAIISLLSPERFGVLKLRYKEANCVRIIILKIDNDDIFYKNSINLVNVTVQFLT